jgi:hypothetical protein
MADSIAEPWLYGLRGQLTGYHTDSAILKGTAFYHSPVGRRPLEGGGTWSG